MTEQPHSYIYLKAYWINIGIIYFYLRFRWSSRIRLRTSWSRSASTDTTPSRTQWTSRVAVSGQETNKKKKTELKKKNVHTFSGRRARALIGCAWILSFVFAVPSVFINEETIIEGIYYIPTLSVISFVKKQKYLQ